MNNNILDQFVSNVTSNNTEEADATFAEIMRDKVSTEIDAQRIDIGSKVFSEAKKPFKKGDFVTLENGKVGKITNISGDGESVDVKLNGSGKEITTEPNKLSLMKK